jgi:hypothetical protein
MHTFRQLHSSYGHTAHPLHSSYHKYHQLHSSHHDAPDSCAKPPPAQQKPQNPTHPYPRAADTRMPSLNSPASLALRMQALAGCLPQEARLGWRDWGRAIGTWHPGIGAHCRAAQCCSTATQDSCNAVPLLAALRAAHATAGPLGQYGTWCNKQYYQDAPTISYRRLLQSVKKEQHPPCTPQRGPKHARREGERCQLSCPLPTLGYHAHCRTTLCAPAPATCCYDRHVTTCIQHL